MTPPDAPYRTVQCPICRSTVPHSNLEEHLLADARILRVIQSTRPEMSRRECEEYLRSLSGSRAHPKGPS